MKKKCYIAGFIGDLTKEQYEANFTAAEKEVIKLGFEPMNPLKFGHNHDKSWESYMREDIKMLMDCQYLYAQSNIRFSPGGMIELELAAKVGINIIHQNKQSKP